MNNKHITKNLRTMFLIIVQIIVFEANVVFTNAATCATFSTLPQTNTITTDCTVDVPKDILSQTSIVINGVQDSNAILFYQSEPSLQAGIAIGICFMGECMLNYFQPQKNRNLFWLAQISFFFTGVKFGFSFLINGVWGKLRAKSLGTTLICLDCVILVASIVLILYSFKKIPKKDKTKKSNISNLQIVPSLDGDEFTGGRKIEAKLKVKTEEELKEDICDLLLSYYGDKSFEYKQGKSLMEEYDDLDEDEFKGEMKAFLEDMGDKDKAKEEFTNLCHQLMYR